MTKMDQKSNDWRIYKRNIWTQKTHTQGSQPCKDWQNMEWYSYKPRMLRISSNHQKLWSLEEFPRNFRGNIVLLTSWFEASRLQLCERITFYIFVMIYEFVRINKLSRNWTVSSKNLSSYDYLWFLLSCLTFLYLSFHTYEMDIISTLQGC